MKLLKIFIFNIFLFFSLFFLINQVSAAAAPRTANLDVNRDGIISKIDKNFVQDNLGSTNPTGTIALADINQDEIINGRDLSFVTQAIGQYISPCETADVNNDSIVNFADLEIIGSFYGQVANSYNMMADLTGDGSINIQDLAKAGGLYTCTWSSI